MKSIGRFRLHTLHRRSGSGDVYLAEDSQPGPHGTRVAVKLVQNAPDSFAGAVEQLLHEARTLERLGPHPNIVQVIAHDRPGKNEAWAAMEFVEHSLEDLMPEEPAPEPDVIRMMRQVAGALKHLHARRQPVLHRNIDPTTILVTRPGPDAVYKITDLALDRAEGGPAVPRSAASAPFMAPEVHAEVDQAESPASDIYSLGMVAYRMLLGKRLFDRQLGERTSDSDAPPRVGQWMQWQISRALRLPAVAELVPGVSPELSDLITRMTAKTPDSRCRSADEVLATLNALSDGGRPMPVPELRLPVPWYRRVDVLVGGAIAMAALAITALLLSRPTTALRVPDAGHFVAQGPSVEVRAVVLNPPPDAIVRVVLPGNTSVPLLQVPARSKERGSHFAGMVGVDEPGELNARVQVLSSDARTLASAPIVVERLPGVVVLLETSPARPDLTLSVRSSGGTPLQLVTDQDGRTSFQADPGEYMLEGQDARFAVSPGSRLLVVDPGVRMSATLKLWNRLGTLRVRAEPPGARVSFVRDGHADESAIAADGLVERELQAGEWRVVATADGYLADERSVDVPRGQAHEVQLRLVKAPEPKPPEARRASTDEIRQYFSANLPLAQLTLTEIPSSGKLRVAGVVLSSAELALARERIQPVADRVVDELTIDPEALARLVARRLEDSGAGAIRVRLVNGGDRLHVQARATAACPAERCAPLASAFLLRPEHLSLRLLKD